MEENKHFSEERARLLSNLSSESSDSSDSPDYAKINKEASESVARIRKGLVDLTTRINEDREKLQLFLTKSEDSKSENDEKKTY